MCIRDRCWVCLAGCEASGTQEVVVGLLEEEMKRYRPTKNYLEAYPLQIRSFESPLMKAEMERIAQHQPMEMLSMRRYELPQPSAAQKNDVSAWQEAVDNSMAQLEHQAGRIVNLELLGQYGSNAWRLHNDALQRMVTCEQKALDALRTRTQEVNRCRKTEQTKAGERLSQLEAHWQTLVHKNYEIEKACLLLETEVRQLKHLVKDRNGVAQDATS